MGVLQELGPFWCGRQYDILGQNCCSFANALCERIGVGSIPPWVDRFARVLHGVTQAGPGAVKFAAQGVHNAERAVAYQARQVQHAAGQLWNQWTGGSTPITTSRTLWGTSAFGTTSTAVGTTTLNLGTAEIATQRISSPIIQHPGIGQRVPTPRYSTPVYQRPSPSGVSVNTAAGVSVHTPAGVSVNIAAAPIPASPRGQRRSVYGAPVAPVATTPRQVIRRASGPAISGPAMVTTAVTSASEPQRRRFTTLGGQVAPGTVTNAFGYRQRGATVESPIATLNRSHIVSI